MGVICNFCDPKDQHTLIDEFNDSQSLLPSHQPIDIMTNNNMLTCIIYQIKSTLLKHFPLFIDISNNSIVVRQLIYIYIEIDYLPILSTQ